MAIQMALLIFISILVLLSSCHTVFAQQPEFYFSWADDKAAFKAGELAAVNIQLSPPGIAIDESKFHPTLSVNAKVGNSSYISDIVTDFGHRKILFTPMCSGFFNLIIAEDDYRVFDSSLRFRVEPGEMYPSVCVASWANYTNEFEAGDKAIIAILPKDAFGNNVTSTIGDPSPSNFSLTAFYSNGSVESFPEITNIGWNEFGYIGIEFVVTKAGHFSLLAMGGNRTLSGNPLQFKVSPGPLDVSNCVAKTETEPNLWQLFSKMEVFVHQRDRFGNLVPGTYEFDAEVIEQETNLSIPVPDLSFKEVAPGIQRLTFVNLEPGNMLLKISDAKHSETISSMPYAYTVFVGYCNGTTSVVNGSGLTDSVAGEVSEFTVYLRDSYEYPSPVEPEMLRVQIAREFDSYDIFAKIVPMQIMNDSEVLSETQSSPSPSPNPSNQSVENSTLLTSAFNVVYTPDKIGVYEIRVFCGNILLNEGHLLTKQVFQGDVNLSLSGVIKFDSKVPKQVKNEVTVKLVDSFNNPVLSQQSKLQLDGSSTTSTTNSSGFSAWMFADNNDGSYTAYYAAEDIGTYEIFASFDGRRFLPPSFEVNVYSSEYFPRAFVDQISVWEDESVAFDALANDYFAGKNATILDLSEPSHGSLVQYERLLRYTPQKDYYGNDSFVYTISDLNGNLATASVNISVLAIPPQLISFPSHLESTEDEISPRFGGFSSFELRFSDINENISVNVSTQSGSIYLSPMAMQFWPTNSKFSVYKSEPKSLVLEGKVEIVNFALNSIQYFGNKDYFGTDVLRLAMRSTNGVNNLDIPVNVDPINDPPFIHVPGFIILKSNEDESLIYNTEKDKFEFAIGDPDLNGFPGDESLFLVIFSVEVDSGFLSTSLPSELINTTELRTMSTYQWQPLQSYVTISQHFAVKANGIRFRGTIKDCNVVMKQLFYSGKGHGTVLTVTVNDMGNYGCYPDCAEQSTMPLYTRATVNLIRRRPMSSYVSHILGSAIVVESIIVLSLGVVLLSFTCKCALVLIHHKRNSNASSQPNNSIKVT